MKRGIPTEWWLVLLGLTWLPTPTLAQVASQYPHPHSSYPTTPIDWNAPAAGLPAIPPALPNYGPGPNYHSSVNPNSNRHDVGYQPMPMQMPMPMPMPSKMGTATGPGMMPIPMPQPMAFQPVVAQQNQSQTQDQNQYQAQPNPPTNGAAPMTQNAPPTLGTATYPTMPGYPLSSSYVPSAPVAGVTGVAGAPVINTYVPGPGSDLSGIGVASWSLGNLTKKWFSTYGPRIGVRYTGTDDDQGIGFQNNFTSIEAFIPLPHRYSDRLAFFDWRLLIDDKGNYGANIGGGYRIYDAISNRVYGGYLFYDNRDTGTNTFSQVMFGVETLGYYLDGRANAYIPVGTQQKGMGTSIFSGPRFVGKNILFTRNEQFEEALAGFNIEGGGLVVDGGQFQLRGYVGGYHFQGEINEEFVWGFMGRVEARITNLLTLGAAYTSDDVFDDNILFTVAANFPGYNPRGSGLSASPADRLAESVQRLQAIVVDRSGRNTDVLARDAVTGLPVVINYVDAAAGAGGNGTIENPFRTLPEAELGSAANEIILVRAGTYDGNIVLQDNQRFLGSGIPHFVNTDFGLIQLPATGTGVTPVINGATLADLGAVVLANNNEVNGFRIQNTASSGVFGQNIVNPNLLNLDLANNDLDGIRLINVAGTANLANIVVNNSGLSGIGVVNNNGSALQVNLNAVAVADTGLDGIAFDADGGSVVAANLDNILVARAGAAGIRGRASGNSQLNLDLSRGQLVANTASGVLLEAVGTSIINTTIADSSITSTQFGDAILLTAFDNATINATVQNNILNTNFFSGVNAGIAGGQANLNIVNNTINSNGAEGIFVQASGTSQVNSFIQGNLIAGNGSLFGLEAAADGTAIHRVQLFNNSSDLGYLINNINSPNSTLSLQENNNIGGITTIGLIAP